MAISISQHFGEYNLKIYIFSMLRINVTDRYIVVLVVMIVWWYGGT